MLNNFATGKLSAGLSAVKAQKNGILCTGAAVLLFNTVSAHAADTDSARRTGSLVEEVVVTAQKRSQSIQDVGIAITAFSGDQLKNFGFTDSVDLAKMTPNVAVSGSYAGQMSQFTIRGVTQNDFNDHVESVIAVYIDEAYVAMQQGQTFSMFDIDRVEVLKGPQGTLFGRNATGGLVHFVTKRPTDEFEGYADVSYGSYDEIRFESAVGGPITDAVSGRLSMLYNSHDGYLKNKYPNETFVPAAFEADLNSATLSGTGDDLGGVDSSWAVRGQLNFEVSGSTSLLLSAFGGKTTASIGPYQQIPSISIFDATGQQINTIYPSATEVCEAIQIGTGCINGPFDNNPADVERPVPGADFFGYRDPDGSDFKTSSDYAFDDFNEYETKGITANLSVEFDSFTFTSITDYKDFDKFFGLDLEAAPVNQFFWIGEADEQTITQEFRLNGSTESLTWVAGIYYLDIDNESVHGFGALPDSAYFFPAWDQPRIVNMETQSYSLFGQVEFALTDTLSLTAGIRGTKEEKDFEHEVVFVFPTTGGDPKDWDYDPAAPFPGFFRPLYKEDSSEDLWTWKLQLDYRPNEDWLVYAGINQGVKAGSFNAGDPSILESQLPYDKEVLLSYEVGFKSTLNDGNMRFNGAAYYYDYSDYQASRWTGVANVIVNADATIWGAELELMASVTENLEVLLAAGYQENTIEDVPIAGGFRDVESTFAPNFTASAMAKYHFPQEVFGGGVSLQVDVNHQSEVWHNLSNFDATQLDSYTLGNVRLSWLNADGDLRIDLFGKNIGDVVYDSIGFDLSQVCGCNLQAQGKPRWWGVSLRKDF